MTSVLFTIFSYKSDRTDGVITKRLSRNLGMVSPLCFVIITSSLLYKAEMKYLHAVEIQWSNSVNQL